MTCHGYSIRIPAVLRYVDLAALSLQALSWELKTIEQQLGAAAAEFERTSGEEAIDPIGNLGCIGKICSFSRCFGCFRPVQSES